MCVCVGSTPIVPLVLSFDILAPAFFPFYSSQKNLTVRTEIKHGG